MAYSSSAPDAPMSPNGNVPDQLLAPGFAHLFRETADLVLLLDDTGALLAVNPAFETYTGWTAADCLADPEYWAKLVHADDHTTWRTMLTAGNSQTSMSASHELRWLGAAGIFQWFELHCRPVHAADRQDTSWIIVAHNIHPRKERERHSQQQEGSLERRNERAQMLISRLKHLLGKVGALPADITAYCEGTCEILREIYRSDAVYIHTSTNDTVYHHAAHTAAADAPFRVPPSLNSTVIQSEAPLYSNRLHLTDPYRHDEAVRRAGYRTYLGAPLRDSSGLLRGVLGVLSTEKKYYDQAEVELITIAALQVAARLRAEDQLAENRALAEHLRHAQKMEAVGLLAGGIAHNINNILSGILGFASHLTTKVEKGTTWHRDLQLIEQSAVRAAELTNQLLSFARRRPMHKQPVGINRIVQDVLHLVRRSVAKDCAIEVELSPDPDTVLGDAGQLNQAFMNLCLNAVEALRDQPDAMLHIRTETRVLAAHECKWLNAPTTTPYVCIYCRDNGVGIPAEQQPHIFEPFYTTRSDTGGTGLGLSIVYGIITNHGGHVRVDSVEGQGTEFTCYLPASDQPAVAPAPDMPTVVGGTETILVVDDEHVVRHMVTEVLTAHGYKVRSVESGHAALALLDQARGRIDLVLLDMVMPGLDGERTFRALRAMVPDQRILLTSGFVQQEKTDRLLAAGAAGMVTKPYRSEALLQQIRQALDHHA